MIEPMTHKDGTAPRNGEIFVFGSNLAGRHGAGAALAAVMHFGAEYGVGVGHVGNSYAIPTKDEYIVTLDMNTIAFHVGEFNEFAETHPEMQFWLTRVGCGLAGLRDCDMAPLFKLLPNVNYPEEWVDYIG